jgi:hypothetical protein
MIGWKRIIAVSSARLMLLLPEMNYACAPYYTKLLLLRWCCTSCTESLYLEDYFNYSIVLFLFLSLTDVTGVGGRHDEDIRWTIIIPMARWDVAAELGCMLMGWETLALSWQILECVSDYKITLDHLFWITLNYSNSIVLFDKKKWIHTENSTFMTYFLNYLFSYWANFHSVYITVMSHDPINILECMCLRSSDYKSQSNSQDKLKSITFILMDNVFS